MKKTTSADDLEERLIDFSGRVIQGCRQIAEDAGDADTYPPYDEVLAKLQKVHQANMALLETMSEDDLNSPSKACPPEYEGFFGTYRQCFQQIANHWWMHQGQVADARRALGRKPLMA